MHGPRRDPGTPTRAFDVQQPYGVVRRTRCPASPRNGNAKAFGQESRPRAALWPLRAQAGRGRILWHTQVTYMCRVPDAGSRAHREQLDREGLTRGHRRRRGAVERPSDVAERGAHRRAGLRSADARLGHGDLLARRRRQATG